MRISTNSQTEGLKYSMMMQANKIDKAQQQVASGNKYEKFSDAPLMANQQLILENSQAKVNQYNKNVEDANTYLSSVEATLGQVVNLMKEVRNTALQANNGTASQADLNTYKAVIEENIKQLEGLANSEFLGKYVFSGEKTQTKPYDLSSGAAVYQGSTDSVKIRVSTTKEMEISVIGSDTFQSAFDALFNAKNALEAGNKINLDEIDKASNTIIDARSDIGVRMESAEMYKTLYEQEALNLKTRISAVKDADISEAMINLTQNNFIRESIYSITAKMNQTSLLNYLK